MTALSTPTELFGFGDIVAAAPTSWPSGLSIRPRRADDCDALLRLFTQADFQRNASTLDPFERPDDARALLDRAGPGAFEMVAVQNGHRRWPACSERKILHGGGAGDMRDAAETDVSAGIVIGFAGLYAFAGRQRHVGCCTLAVDEQFQRRGVGTALLQALLRSAYDYVGLERVQLTVFADNVRAIALYRRAGFRTEGVLRSFARRDDGMVDAFLLAHCASPKAHLPRRKTDAAASGSAYR